MKENGKFPTFEGWSRSIGRYGAFTYSVKENDIIINYIKNQKEYRKCVPPQGTAPGRDYDEFKRLLIENEIEFDEKYLL
jgi:putative transposase